MPALDIVELIDLKDRAMLSAHLKDANYDDPEKNEKDLQLLNTFISFVETITDILANLKSLHGSCYRNKIIRIRFNLLYCLVASRIQAARPRLFYHAGAFVSQFKLSQGTQNNRRHTNINKKQKRVFVK